MCQFSADSAVAVPVLAPAFAVARRWAMEKPAGSVSIVYGPLGRWWYVALCKKARSPLGWRSLGFCIPPQGLPEGENAYRYGVSVNWIEFRTGYNLFPKLPAHIQEIVEEMTASDILCPIQESELPYMDSPEQEIEYDMELDYRERG